MARRDPPGLRRDGRHVGRLLGSTVGFHTSLSGASKKRTASLPGCRVTPAKSEIPAAITKQPQRHLTSVESPQRFLDRRPQPFIPVYAELFRAGRDTAGRDGYALPGSVAVFYSVIVYLQGSPTDGRRRSRAETDGLERFSPRTVGAGDLSRMYGWSYDEIQSWAETCAVARACPHCERGHALLEIDRRVGKRNRYRLVRCQDLSDEQCCSLQAVARKKRQATGAADPKRRQSREDAQQSLPFASRLDETMLAAETLGESPRVGTSEAALPALAATGIPVGTLGKSPRVSVDSRTDLGRSAADDSTSRSVPASVDEAKMMVLRGFAALQRIDASAETLAVIARAVDEPEELLNALVFTVALASIEHVPICPSLAQAAMDRRTERSVEPSENVRGSDWADNRILELARRVEPHTTTAQVSSMSGEFQAQCLAHAGGDNAEAAKLLQRILTDPRICGAPGCDPPLKPLALLRDGFRKGWIWTEAHQDDGSAPLARAYERLNPGDRHEVERIFRNRSEGASLDIARLRKHKITSKAMIGYLARRFDAARDSS